MLKTAWILPLMMVVAIIIASLAAAEASAAGNEFQRRAQTRFHDLPGVIPEAERVQRQQGYSCTSTIEHVYRGRGRYDILYGDTAPRRVYHCKTESGLSYSGTRLPNEHWVPGLNPLHLPK